MIGGAAAFGYIKKSILDMTLSIIAALKEQIELLESKVYSVEQENKQTKRELIRLRKERELTSKQLAVSLRLIEYFERVITVVIKGRPRMPGDLVSQIDTGMQELARFRDQAALDLESMEVNREHYDWLLTREAIMGPVRDTQTSSEQEGNNIT